jgi:hypothetical protein
MLHRLACLLAMLWALGSVAPLSAQQRARDPLEVTNIRVGFIAPAQERGLVTLYKQGSWIPIYVSITCAKPYPTPAELVIESMDCDDVPTRYAVPIPQMQPGASETIIGYTRPSQRGEFTISLRSAGRDICEPKEEKLGSGMEPDRVLYLTMGSHIEGVRLPGIATPQDDNSTSYHETRASSCVMTNVNQLPNMWFGYDAIDVAILSTQDREFATRLSEEREGRRTALLDWVRRGGQLIVSVGSSADLLAATDQLKEALPVTIDGTSEVNLARLGWRNGPTADEPLGKITVAKIVPKAGRTANVLMTGPAGADGKAIPLIVRGSFGLGRITVVAFDMDSKQAATWKSAKSFWDELIKRAGLRVPDAPAAGGNRFSRFGGQPSGAEDGHRQGLTQQMEDFPGVPVISFGWVALFILIYIIIVGPLDYFFLKKVVKRLELTWITFPTIVLVVSTAAYYAAYALKGSDLRINKYDLVDIDLASRTVVGRSWFTLFSPRIQNYRVGLESASPKWAENEPGNVTTSWSGLPHGARQGLFRRGYSYTAGATGLDGVPVQVWSTKGFESQWLSTLGDKSQLIDSNLSHPPGSTAIIGSITANLPVPLENAFLITPGSKPEVIPLGVLVPGTPKQVTAQETRQFSTWVNSPLNAGIAANRTDVQQITYTQGWLPANMLFHEAAIQEAGALQNASMRILDQSWHLSGDNPNEAILVGTLPRREGTSEEITADPASPSHLWLGDFPESGRPRPKLEGKMRQDTCIRVIIPIRSADTLPPKPTATERP